MDKALDAPAVIVNDKRRFNQEPPVLEVPAHPVRVPGAPVDRRLMHAGEFYEINGVCWRVHKVTKDGVLLRRFTGTLLVDKANATAQQIRGARPA